MRTTILAVISILFAATGCVSLGRDTPPLEQYVLGSTPPAAEAASANASGVAVGLRRLDLTPYLASPSIVVRRGVNQITVSEYHRWGEDPVAGINRAVARYLRAAPQVRAVDVAPWAVRSPHDFVVQLHVSRFEGAAPADSLAVEGEAHLLASWEIHRPRDGGLLARGTIDYRAEGWPLGDYPALVTLLDGGLSRMASQIAACMARVGPAADLTSPQAAAATALPLACT
ncbi:MAG: PqiC family protein [Gemmatimonadota bacterium]